MDVLFTLFLNTMLCISSTQTVVVVVVVIEGQEQVVLPGALAKRSQEESWAQWSLLRGMGSLPEALADWLLQSGKVQLCRDAVVKEIHLSSSGWEVSDGE